MTLHHDLPSLSLFLRVSVMLAPSVILSGAKNLVFSFLSRNYEILRFAQNDTIRMIIPLDNDTVGMTLIKSFVS